jgi:hypothetical protein
MVHVTFVPLWDKPGSLFARTIHLLCDMYTGAQFVRLFLIFRWIVSVHQCIFNHVIVACSWNSCLVVIEKHIPINFDTNDTLTTCWGKDRGTFMQLNVSSMQACVSSILHRAGDAAHFTRYNIGRQLSQILGWFMLTCIVRVWSFQVNVLECIYINRSTDLQNRKYMWEQKTRHFT